MSGRVVHFEIPFDGDRARIFYKEVFDWALGFAAYFTDPEGNVVGLWGTARPT
ncbi:VOC family protein [Blastococcus mobilis]|uniref:Glyoxalase/Bleomycin resistance-like N-terminal domain-containing protein n=1 Tax=Blastococcus mobilis TaxID=1938746 RepID=A0A238WJ36_9ACTN|nr:hypothetical protein [Blastococcus mobilis]SNR46497.1 hypothetical protein SAMN06272737_10875 [Blastococcus mobilis]